MNKYNWQVLEYRMNSVEHSNYCSLNPCSNAVMRGACCIELDECSSLCLRFMIADRGRMHEAPIVTLTVQ